jgi:hypothetical protein
VAGICDAQTHANLCCSPFLKGVTSAADFDTALSNYVSGGYVIEKYQNLFGCGNVDLSNTTSYYARYTTSFICNGVIQNSRQPCGLSGNALRPLCAESCADLAQSEQQITSDSGLCSNPGSNYLAQIRADFTNCALPANSLNGASCITGAENEPDNCGFGSSLLGLCNYCRASSENATDSCCVTSNSTGRCQGVSLPVFSTMSNFLSSATSTGAAATGTSAAATSHHGSGLSGGAIAGIVIGSIVGFLLLLALLIACCIFMRRRKRGSTNNSVLNQPSPQRKGAQAMSYNPPGSQQGYEVLPGGRVARMSALQGDSAPETAVGQRGYGSDSDPYGDSPGSREKAAGVIGAGALGAGVIAARRDRSRSSKDANDSSPSSGNQFSSPEGVASGQSEQLPFFKDYYSSDDIHPNDRVSVLWAYQPRAGDEFELERGDMLKVVGIWDDGWATGVRIDDRAEDYDGKHKAQRDSGVSNGSAARPESPPPTGEIKAFPLVCVCLPEAWKKTVDGDTSTESGGSGGPPVT